MTCNSLSFVGWKKKKAPATDLKELYRATADEDAALTVSASAF